ncbi:MAG: hypothetical protein H6502_04205 [Candidatus Woesearchaeota archaeon]|nr:MAG: hypothetical protein H6502_04205 [Candidatus Woesearchaeota archaeon]
MNLRVLGTVALLVVLLFFTHLQKEEFTTDPSVHITFNFSNQENASLLFEYLVIENANCSQAIVTSPLKELVEPLQNNTLVKNIALPPLSDFRFELICSEDAPTELYLLISYVQESESKTEQVIVRQ